MSSLGALSVEITADTSDLNQGLGAAESRLESFGRQSRAVVNRMAAVGAAATAAGAALAMDFTRRGLAAIDAQAKLSRSLDGTIDGLRAVQEAGEDAGIAAAQVGSEMQKMHARLAEAARGSGTAAEAMQRLGLSAQDLLAMDVDERMAVIADRMRELNFTSAQAQDALRELGIRNREMALLMTQGGDAIRSARQEVDDFGLSVSDVDAAQVEAANDAMRRLGRTLEVIQQQLAIGLAPFITEISNRFNEATADAGGFQSQIQSTVETSIQRIGFLLDVIEGIRRAFMLAGQATAVAALSMQNVMMRTANIILEGPTKAINTLIDQANRLPGVDIEMRQPINLAQRMRREIELSEEAVRHGLADMNATLMEPMPSAGIEDTLQRVRDASSEAADKVIEDQKRVGAFIDESDIVPGPTEEQMEEQEEKEREFLERRLERLQEFMMDEKELEEHNHERRMEELREFHEAELLEDEEFQAMREELKAQHEERMSQLTKDGEEERLNLMQRLMRAQTAAQSSEMANQVRTIHSGLSSMFGELSAFGDALGLLKRAESIISAYAWGSSIGGPPAGAAAAAAAAAAQAQNLSQMRGASFGGSSPSGGTGGAAPSGGGSGGGAPAGGGQEAQTLVANVNIQGGSGAAIRRLIEDINVELEGGMRIG